MWNIYIYYIYLYVETVREFTYLGERVSAGGGCEDVSLPEQDVGGLSLGSAMRCYMAGGFLYS